MNTPGSAAAFAKLVDARERLTEVTRLLNTHSECEINNDPREGFRAHKARYLQLQTEWEAAYAEFERATQEFNDLVKSLRASDDKFSS
jgi:hypothetical protein